MFHQNCKRRRVVISTSLFILSFFSPHSVTLYKTQDEYAAEFPPNACIETKLRRFHISRLSLAFILWWSSIQPAGRRHLQRVEVLSIFYKFTFTLYIIHYTSYIYIFTIHTLHLSQESLRISYTVSFPLHCKQSAHLCQRSVSYI